MNNMILQIDLKYDTIFLLQGSKTPSTMEPQNVACIQSMSIYLTLGKDFFITGQNTDNDKNLNQFKIGLKSLNNKKVLTHELL